ncbi:Hypothetical protein TPAS_2967 [Trichococcus pasteurii]|uniref:Uncharacterized protein n=1 Tax=Trichococcus pasteurii TaxID=43064 RepID=A0A1W1IK97_9LACT|nr:Hypothetical protein TPAS_2967 [Trichococcus pasteurii]SSB94120.1 Hypothetical protein TPAS_2967 [Trichococcus pasteurii]
MAVIFQTNKKTGITYAYQNERKRQIIRYILQHE